MSTLSNVKLNASNHEPRFQMLNCYEFLWVSHSQAPFINESRAVASPGEATFRGQKLKASKGGPPRPSWERLSRSGSRHTKQLPVKTWSALTRALFEFRKKSARSRGTLARHTPGTSSWRTWVTRSKETAVGMESQELERWSPQPSASLLFVVHVSHCSSTRSWRASLHTHCSFDDLFGVFS